MADIAAVTQVIIQGKDETQPAIRSVVTGITSITTAAEEAQAAFKSLAGALGVTLSIAEIINFTKGVVEAAEGLNNLAKTTGSTVEELSMLQNAVRISGGSADVFNTMLARMASNMETLDEQSTKAQKALEFLGVTAKDPAEALRQAAIELDKFADGAGKAAAMRDLFGKGGAEMAANIHAIATASKDMVTVTTEQAEAAAKLSEELRRLTLSYGGLKDAILSTVVPTINSWIDNVKAARAAGLSWADSLALMDSNAERIGPLIASTTAEVKKLNDELEDSKKKFGNWAPAIIADLENAQKRLQALKNIQLVIAQSMISPANMDARDRALAQAKPELDYSNTTAKLSDFDKMLQQVIADERKAGDALDEAFGAEPITQAEQSLRKMMADPAWQKLRDEDKFAIEFFEAQNAATEATARHISEWAAASAKFAAQRQKDEDAYIDSLRKEAAALDLSIEAVREETNTLGQSADEKARAKMITDAYTLALKQGTAETEDFVKKQAEINKAFDDLIAGKQAHEAAQKTQQEFEQASKQIESDLERAFVDGFANAGNLARSFKTLLVDMFSKLVLRPILQPVSNLIAGATQGIAGSVAGGGGGVSGLLNLAGLFGAGAGGAAIAPTLFGASTFGAAGVGGITAGIGFGSALAPTGLAALMPALGPIAILGAGLFVASMLSDKTKSAVKAQLGFSAGTTGFEDQAFTATKYFGNIGFLDQATQQFSGVAAQTFTKTIGGILDIIGGKMTPEQRTSTAAILQRTQFPGFEGEYSTEDFLKKYGGTILRQVSDIALGQLNPALKGMVAAFKGADEALPQFIQTLVDFNDVVTQLPADIQQRLIAAADGTQEMADKLLEFGKTYLTVKQILDANPIADADFILAGQTAAGAFKQQGEALIKLANTYDGTTEASKNLATASTDYYNSLVQLLAQIKQMKQEIDAMFGDTARSFKLATMTKQQQYEFYRTEAGQLEEQLKHTTDPAEIQRIARQINADFTAAWGLLTPEQQKAGLADYLAGINRVNTEAQKQLDDAAKETRKTADDILKQVRDVLNEAAKKFDHAADKMQNAADTPTTINVHVTSDTPVASEVG